jgi:hemolysin III
MSRRDGVYTQAERRSDAIVHWTGLVLGLAAAPVVVGLALRAPDGTTLVAAAAIYAASLVAMLGASAAYHMSRAPAWRDRLRRLDQSAIYVKIAGAYTPFAVMTGPEAMPFLGGLWAAALVGVGLKVLTARQLFGVTLALYLGMGWAALAVGGPIFERMTPEAFRLVFAGGSLYTAGVVFLVWDRLPHHYTIWHVFVLAASLFVYAAVLMEVAGFAAGV